MRELGARKNAWAVGREDAIRALRQALRAGVLEADTKPVCRCSRLAERRVAKLSPCPADARGDPGAIVRNVVRDRNEQRGELVVVVVRKRRHSICVEHRVRLRYYQFWLLYALYDVPPVEAEPLAALLAVAVVAKPFPPRLVTALVRQVVGNDRKRGIAPEVFVAVPIKRRSRHERVVLEVEHALVAAEIVGEIVKLDVLCESCVERDRLEASWRPVLVDELQVALPIATHLQGDTGVLPVIAVLLRDPHALANVPKTVRLARERLVRLAAEHAL